MKMNVSIVMSAELASRTPAGDAENMRRTAELHLALHERDLTFVPARGFYKGSEERSVVVLIDDSDDYDFVLALAFERFEQESVLVVDANYVARFVYAKGGIERAGMMVKVDERIARSREGWTRIGLGTPAAPQFDWWVLEREATPLVEAVYPAEAAKLNLLPVVH